MATIRPFSIFDTLTFNNINLDMLTETVKEKSLYFLLNTSLTHFSMENTLQNGQNIV